MIFGILLFLVFVGFAFYVYYKGFFKTPTEETMISFKKEKRNHVMKFVKSQGKKDNSGVFRRTKKIRNRWKKIYPQT